MNRNNSGANTNMIQICLDVITLLVAYLLEYLFFREKAGIRALTYTLAIVIVFAIIYILSNKEARLYNVTLFFYMDRFHHIITRSWLIAAVATAMILFVFNFGGIVRVIYLWYLIIAYILLCINMVSSRLLTYIRHNYQAPRAAYVGVFEDYRKFNYFLNKTSIKLEEIGYILKQGEQSDGMFNVLGSIDEMEEIIRSNEVDQIYFMQKNDDKISDIQKYIDICLEMGITVKVIIDTYVMSRSNSYVSSVGTYPIITYHTVALNSYEQMLKRLVDVVVSMAAIIIASPVMLLTAAAIKHDSDGPVLFDQVRVGQNGRSFHMLKFRSMYVDAEERKKELLDQNEMTDGLMFKMKNDPRITRVGKFIRRTSIDELPQLFNVLQGTMSLVGTRPPTLDEVENYKRSQWRRISIKPGITGMWQVSGRNDIRDFDDIVEMDLKYIDNWTLWLDVKILFQTIGVLLRGNGAY